MSSLALTGKSRQLITKLHRWSGLALLAFLFVAAFTGVFVSFRWEIDAFLNPQLFKVQPGDKALPQLELIGRIETAFPDALVSTLTYPAAPDEALRVSLKSRMDAHVVHKHVPGMKSAVAFNQVFVNPYSGEILGQRNTSDFAVDRVNFIPFMLRLHYSLFLEKWGVWLMGGSALVWLLSSFLGLTLAWPRLWRSIKAWRPLLGIRSRQGGYKLNYDLHRSASLLTLPVMIVVAFSSAYFNLPDLVKPVIGVFSPISSTSTVASAGKVGLDDSIVPPEQAAAAALQVLPEARVSYVNRDFTKGLYAVRLKLPTDVAPIGNNTVYVRMRDGVVSSTRLAANRSGADTFIAWQMPLHSGVAFGLAGQIIICLCSLALLAMCVTGFNVWLRKHRSEKDLAMRRRARQTPVSEQQAAAPIEA
ncbi:PepSY-associated TM helix domain-containing protein [Quatrionicoccus australiensis]|uniref:PepSY-associated TM helix domain-containing protein n=1 Tax=Quatrionicoccus australiensis TaxID=138118 RepID=UPI001CF817BE|nr:PepSY-associated TM helix domain-containing protein [Quatrionicoccus australiensis]UCV14914.1 PepSY domain-containing protein [Quatrionicoccus australiensis]